LDVIHSNNWHAVALRKERDLNLLAINNRLSRIDEAIPASDACTDEAFSNLYERQYLTIVFGNQDHGVGEGREARNLFRDKRFGPRISKLRQQAGNGVFVFDIC
jgi:hypothetical protein